VQSEPLQRVRAAAMKQRRVQSEPLQRVRAAAMEQRSREIRADSMPLRLPADTGLTFSAGKLSCTCRVH